jgi:hypothetical protein
LIAVLDKPDRSQKPSQTSCKEKVRKSLETTLISKLGGKLFRAKDLGASRRSEVFFDNYT